MVNSTHSLLVVGYQCLSQVSVNQSMLQQESTLSTKSCLLPVDNDIFTELHGMQTQSCDENSVCLSNAWIVTKRKKNQSRFLHHMKDHLS